MDEPVPRRNFVRLVASDAVHNAGRIAALSGVAAGVVAQGMASLTETFDDQPRAPVPPGVTSFDPVADPRSATMRQAAPAPVPQASPPAGARLDEATRRLLGAVDHGWLAVNRRNVGPLVLPITFRLDGDRLSIRGHAGSAMALAVAADANVTLIVDDTDHGQRCLVFGSAALLEGTAAASTDDDDDQAVDVDRAVIRIQPTHTLRMPV